jgi:hypothetical protein
MLLLEEERVRRDASPTLKRDAFAGGGESKAGRLTYAKARCLAGEEERVRRDASPTLMRDVFTGGGEGKAGRLTYANARRFYWGRRG